MSRARNSDVRLGALLAAGALTLHQLGTAGSGTDYSSVGSDAIWYVQVAALVAGHVTALVPARLVLALPGQRVMRTVR